MATSQGPGVPGREEALGKYLLNEGVRRPDLESGHGPLTSAGCSTDPSEPQSPVPKIKMIIGLVITPNSEVFCFRVKRENA